MGKARLYARLLGLSDADAELVLAYNRARPAARPGAVRAEADRDGGALVRLYGEIGSSLFSEGVTAESFAKTLDGLGEVGRITLRINSPGGSLFDGIAMYNLLRTHGAQICVVVDALAASAASIVAQAADPGELAVASSAQIMIHNAHGVCVGDAGEMDRTADLLRRADQQIAAVYQERSGAPARHWLELMGEESWFRGQEAVDAGLADCVVTPRPKPAAHANRVAAALRRLERDDVRERRRQLDSDDVAEVRRKLERDALVYGE